jgi:1-acyl-sn-glycerol-3-phosphate acyltransferase
MKRLLTKLKESRIVKGFLYAIIGLCSYPGLNIINKLTIKGTENLEGLPKKNVLFVSNHQTYFADVIAFLHIFCAVNWGRKNKLGVPWYLLWPFTRVKYVAAAETMRSGWMSRLFSLAGAITVRRTWNTKGAEQRKGLDPGDTRKITRALENNWVITFPQGTTKPFAPGRKGTAFIIKQNHPIVVPVQISGFWRAFNKKGLKFKKKGTKLAVTFMKPLTIDFNDSTENILAQVMEAIGQKQPSPAQIMP